MVSNHFFYNRQGYFDVASDAQPMLHTWSLSVEEQFYVIAPVVMFFGWRYLPRKFAIALAGLAAAASLAGCIAFAARDQSMTFFIMPFRAWEFVAGGAVGFIAARLASQSIVLTASLGFLGCGVDRRSRGLCERAAISFVLRSAAGGRGGGGARLRTGPSAGTLRARAIAAPTRGDRRALLRLVPVALAADLARPHHALRRGRTCTRQPDGSHWPFAGGGELLPGRKAHPEATMALSAGTRAGGGPCCSSAFRRTTHSKRARNLQRSRRCRYGWCHVRPNARATARTASLTYWVNAERRVVGR